MSQLGLAQQPPPPQKTMSIVMFLNHSMMGHHIVIRSCTWYHISSLSWVWVKVLCKICSNFTHWIMLYFARASLSYPHDVDAFMSICTTTTTRWYIVPQYLSENTFNIVFYGCGQLLLLLMCVTYYLVLIYYCLLVYLECKKSGSISLLLLVGAS